MQVGRAYSPRKAWHPKGTPPPIQSGEEEQRKCPGNLSQLSPRWLWSWTPEASHTKRSGFPVLYNELSKVASCLCLPVGMHPLKLLSAIFKVPKECKPKRVEKGGCWLRHPKDSNTLLEPRSSSKGPLFKVPKECKPPKRVEGEGCWPRHPKIRMLPMNRDQHSKGR